MTTFVYEAIIIIKCESSGTDDLKSRIFQNEDDIPNWIIHEVSESVQDDPMIDWDKVKTLDDVRKLLMEQDDEDLIIDWEISKKTVQCSSLTNGMYEKKQLKDKTIDLIEDICDVGERGPSDLRVYDADSFSILCDKIVPCILDHMTPYKLKYLLGELTEQKTAFNTTQNASTRGGKKRKAQSEYPRAARYEETSQDT